MLDLEAKPTHIAAPIAAPHRPPLRQVTALAFALVGVLFALHASKVFLPLHRLESIGAAKVLESSFGNRSTGNAAIMPYYTLALLFTSNNKTNFSVVADGKPLELKTPRSPAALEDGEYIIDRGYLCWKQSTPPASRYDLLTRPYLSWSKYVSIVFLLLAAALSTREIAQFIRRTYGELNDQFEMSNKRVVDSERHAMQASVHTRLTPMYLPCLDGLRAVSILLVLFAHNLGPFSEPIGSFFGGGYGVDIFFIISGFLITTLLLNESDRNNGSFDLRAFYLRRILRIAPAFYFFIGASIFWHVYRYGDHHLKPYLYASLYLTNLSFAFKLNLIPVIYNLGHLWSLALEEQFYVVWPATMRLLRKSGSKKILLGLAGFYIVKLGVVLSYVLARPDDASIVNVFLGMDFILYGIAAAFMLREDECIRFIKKYFHSTKSQLLLGAVALAAARWLATGNPAGGNPTGLLVYWIVQTPLALGLATLFLMAVLVHPHELPSRSLSNRILCFVGKLSYSIYLWHELVHEVYRSYFGTFADSYPCQAEFIQFALIFLAACVSYFIIEKPFLMLKTWMARPRATRAQDAAPAPDIRQERLY